MGLRTVLIVLVLLGSGCATTPPGPWVLDSREMRTRPTRVGEWIASYQQALAATLDVFEKDLGFPQLEVRLVFLPDEPTFEQLLLEIGYPAQLARDAAADMTAIGGHRSVLLNQERVERRSWPARVGLLAHELTHVLQYELGGGTRGESDQWLREGYAEWVESRVLQSLHFGGREALREALREARGQLRGHRPDTLPPLTALGTFPEWVSRGRHGVGPLLYTQAFAAVGFLIERHGTPAVLDYFSRFARSQDRDGNFEGAFGETRAEFETAFRQSVWGR